MGMKRLDIICTKDGFLAESMMSLYCIVLQAQNDYSQSCSTCSTVQHSPERDKAGKLINSNPSDVSNSGLGEK